MNKAKTCLKFLTGNGKPAIEFGIKSNNKDDGDDTNCFDIETQRTAGT